MRMGLLHQIFVKESSSNVPCHKHQLPQQQLSNETLTDEASSVSSAMSVINTMYGETERRKTKLKDIRKESPVNDHNYSTANSNHLGRSLRSIMTVHTLQESLATISNTNNWKNVVDNKRKRRRLRTRLDEVVKDISRKNPEIAPDSKGSGNFSSPTSFKAAGNSEGMSEVESIGSSMSSLSLISVEKFDVKYDSVSIREYDITAGDNPSVNQGPPIAIEWDHFNEETVNLEYYEQARKDQRRLQSEMKIPPSVRIQMLKNRGYSTKDIRLVSKEATLIRRQRVRSLETMHHDEVGERFEAAKRLLLKPFKSKEERKTESELKQYSKQSNVALEKDEFDLDTSKRFKKFNIYDDSEEVKMIPSEGICRDNGEDSI